MMPCCLLRAVTVVIFTTVAHAILWSSSPEVEKNITACEGDDVSIPWSFTTNPTETVIGITWFLEKNEGKRTMFASLIDGEFISLSRQHVQFVPNAGVLLQNVTVSDTGLYSVHVSTLDDGGHVTISNHSAAVQVSAPPTLSGGQLQARHRAAPVKDEVTGMWYVMLECGQVTNRGQPPVIAEWTSPSGVIYTDVNYQDGYFLLPLQTVESGNYTCYLLEEGPARRCIASDSISLGKATVYVDGENVKWNVMEANERELIEKEKILRLENQALQSEVQNLTQMLHQFQEVIDLQDSSCLAVQQHSSMSGVYQIFVGRVSMSVYCDQITDGGGWTVFQRRQDGSVSFSRNWTNYRLGFGDLNREFWLGLDNLHVLTSSSRYELRVDLETFNGTRASATYSNFRIGDISTNYTFDFDDFLGGSAGDSLTFHRGSGFSTRDRDNKYSCGLMWSGGWWYYNCLYANLNGIYRPTAKTPPSDGVIWKDFTGFRESLKRTEMKIRPT